MVSACSAEMGIAAMPTPDETLARAAGLDRAWEAHRAEVEEAIAAAAKMRASFARPRDAAAEPMPAYSLAPAGKTAP
jgi:hypothetical protein